mmetsp:Transcript_6933/g.26199  ORF Transcript_6933/g.26199 Transcript_6933/m.26199 type:complete len:233 (-) Transcript_6933:153-851(-)
MFWSPGSAWRSRENAVSASFRRPSAINACARLRIAFKYSGSFSKTASTSFSANACSPREAKHAARLQSNSPEPGTEASVVGSSVFSERESDPTRAAATSASVNLSFACSKFPLLKRLFPSCRPFRSNRSCVRSVSVPCEFLVFAAPCRVSANATAKSSSPSFVMRHPSRVFALVYPGSIATASKQHSRACLKKARPWPSSAAALFACVGATVRSIARDSSYATTASANFPFW